MGTYSLTLVIATFLGCAAAHGELNLSPRLAEFEGEGLKFHHLVFADGGQEVTYQQPAGWDFSGGPTKLTLHPKDKISAEATVTRVPQGTPLMLDEAGLKKLVDDAQATLPAGSTDIQILSQEKDAVKIGTKETFLVTMAYVSNGQRFGRSLLFMGRGNELIRFQLICRLEDFKDLHEEFRRSYFTWHNL
ncbi:MAG: hypothetical protein ACR2HH_15925 [Chthoniobacterales bacterium]